MILDEQLNFFNREGLIPGPCETEQEFLQRADYCLRMKENLPDLLQEVSVEDQLLGKTCVLQAAPLMETLYDVVPEWIPIFFSNYKLAPWHGGCAWIFQLTPETPFAAFFQLRMAFRLSSRYLKIYKRDELIAHELVHVARMMFEEPQFEEVIAYQSASSRFQRWFGPIIQSSFESLIFIISVFFVFLLEMYSFFTENFAAVKLALAAACLPLVLIGFGLGRLWIRQQQFTKCLNTLRQLIKNPNHALAVAMRLTDFEIKAFAKWELVDVQKYIEESRSKTLRWRMIVNSFI